MPIKKLGSKNVFVCINPNGEISVYTSVKGAASTAGITRETLRLNGYKYAKRGFRIELLPVNRIKGRDQNGLNKAYNSQ